MSIVAKVKKHTSYGSVWNQGDLIAGFRRSRWPAPKGHTFEVLLCLNAREVGPRGGIRKPAVMAEIVGPSWASVCRAIRSLGFTRPSLTASQVRGK